MPDYTFPARPNLEQYKKQAKDLLRALLNRQPEELARAAAFHPSFKMASGPNFSSHPWKLADAQLILAREHGFPSWPNFAAHLTTLSLQRSVDSLDEPVTAFIRAASVPREGGHASGTLEEAEMILARYPQVRNANIYTSALLADEDRVRSFLTGNPEAARAPGGPYQWDPLTYLCFSRYLRLDRRRAEDFVRTARALLDAGANANTGWYETIDHPNPRQIIESAIYGAAGIAQHPELTRLLLQYGADPNDEETAYHAAENYDLAVLQVLLESGKLNEQSLTTLLVRKADWHHFEGMRLVLEHGADSNAMTRWGYAALQHALRRDNRLANIQLLLDHGADPTRINQHTGKSGIAMAAHRGRADVLSLFAERGIPFGLDAVDRLIAACAQADHSAIQTLSSEVPSLVTELVAKGGVLLAEFAGNGNTEGVRCLLDLGIPADALHEGDGYWDIAKNSTALHVAAWRAWPHTVKLLISRCTPVNAFDGKGRTALALAVRVCVDSYWTDRRSPESVQALLEAGATTDGITIPSGYDEVDQLLIEHIQRTAQ
jgi:ankyrin repeat protein